MNKITNVLIFDKELLNSPNISFKNKISLLIRKYLNVFMNKRSINYLGREFNYDGRFSPVPLQMYPREIALLDKHISMNEIKSVLDIGSNIGQFSFTIKSFYPNTKVYCFEPNRQIFSLLQKNLSYFNGVRLFNYGVGKKGNRTFYFSPSSSGLGSFYEENVHSFGHKDDVRKIKVENIDFGKKELKKLNLPASFDLIKIDVEGAEMEVLEALKGVSCKYLFMEVSANRTGAIGLEKVKEKIKKIFNKSPIIISSNRLFSNSPSIDVIFRID